MSRPACKAVLSEAVVTEGEALGEKYGGASACKAVPRRQLRHNKVLSFRQLLYFLRPGTMSRVTTASLSIALQAIPPHVSDYGCFAMYSVQSIHSLTCQVTTDSLSIADIQLGQRDYCCQLVFFASSRKLLVKLVNRTKSQFREKRCIPYLVLS